MINIGIVCEGPTDYIVLKEVIDKITKNTNYYVQLQPESDLTGMYGNGWKGVWKWCEDNADIKDKLMKDIQPTLDILIIQMDGDVSRKEKISHCWCASNTCEHKDKYDPLECDAQGEIRENCPIILPCTDHLNSSSACIEHLEKLIEKLLHNSLSDTCIVIPCDSTEAWIVAAYDELENAENIEDPWDNIIAKKKFYHNIRISGTQKKQRVFKEFAKVICDKWEKVTELCVSAKKFEKDIILLVNEFGKKAVNYHRP